MIYKIFPYLFIIAGILGFFINIPETDIHSSANPAAKMAFVIQNMPWWGNLICIFIGLIWLWLNGITKGKEQNN